MASEPGKPYFTPEQYFEFERTSEGRNEYEGGYVYPLEAASRSHARITANLLTTVFNKLASAKNNCKAYSKDMLVKAGPRYAYPDLIVTCGQEEFSRANGDMDLLLNPILLGEVLSR